jgi:hypothetical protein
MSHDELTTLMRAAVDDAPQREWTIDRVRRDARARTARRRTWGALGLTSAAACVVAAAALAGGTPAVPVAPESSTVAGTGLAVGFPVGSAIEAVMSALPAGVVVGELPQDIAWSGDSLGVPLVVRGEPAGLALTASDQGCVATSPALDAASLERIAAAVCAARDQALSGPPAQPVPGGGGPAS